MLQVRIFRAISSIFAALATTSCPFRRRAGEASAAVRRGPQRRRQAGLRTHGRRLRARALHAPERALPDRRRGQFRARTRTRRRRSARVRGPPFRPRPSRRSAIRSPGRRRRQPQGRSAGGPGRRDPRPLEPSFGSSVRSSRARPRIVFTSVRPSAPARAAAAAAAADIRDRRRELRVERLRGRRSRRPRRSPPPRPPARQRSGRRRSTRSLRRGSSSSRAQRSAYSRAANPPTDTHTDTPSSRRRGSVSARKRVDPGIGESDRVEHAEVGLRDAHRLVALARKRRHGLRHEGVEALRDLRGGERVEAAGGVQDHAALAPGPALRRTAA